MYVQQQADQGIGDCSDFKSNGTTTAGVVHNLIKNDNHDPTDYEVLTVDAVNVVISTCEASSTCSLSFHGWYSSSAYDSMTSSPWYQPNCEQGFVARHDEMAPTDVSLMSKLKGTSAFRWSTDMNMVLQESSTLPATDNMGNANLTFRFGRPAGGGNLLWST